jgi:hypothetical protein
VKNERNAAKEEAIELKRRIEEFENQAGSQQIAQEQENGKA